MRGQLTSRGSRENSESQRGSALAARRFWRLATMGVATATIAAMLAGPSAAGAADTHPAPGTRLYAGHVLHVGATLRSPSGVYSALWQANGSFGLLKNGHRVWQSTPGSGLASVTTRRADGDLVIRAARAVTGTHMGKTGASSYLALQNDGDLALYNTTGVPIWQGGLHANNWTPTLAAYSREQLYGGSNPAVLCYTCEAANITGTAPPSNTLNSTSDVDNLTGDFSTSNSLFSSPAVGGNLGISLSYDAQLAQAEVTAGSGPGPFGYGWSSDFSASVNQQSGSSPTSSIIVNQGNGSEVTFNESTNPGGGSVLGASTSCQPVGGPNSGDYPTTNKYTAAVSNHQWCALASVQGQIGDLDGTGVTYQVHGGQSIQDFSWNGALAETTTLAASSGTETAGLFMLYNVAGGSVAKTSTGITLTKQCPSGVTCDIVYSSDGRAAVEELSASGQVTTVINPSGATYTLTYDANKNLIAVAKPNGTANASVWNYAYSTSSSSPYSSDLAEIYDPNAGVTTPASLSAGTPHSETIAYTASTSSNPGMVASLTDGTGAATTYSYSAACATGQCVATGQSQTTTVTYPAEVPCPSCAAASPVETDLYSGGLTTSTTLGSSTNPNESETWSYSWNLGGGTANTSEQVTYPNTLNIANSKPPAASIIWDPAGNIVSTSNALGDIATSAFNDVGGNNLPELLWSFPGPSSNAPSSPPAGASIYTYNRFGQVVTATDPVGSSTDYGYYGPYSLACYVSPPNVSQSLGASPPGCTGSTDTGATGAPSGSTTFSYDAQGDVVSTTVDANDSSGAADTQTTTSNFDVMGNQLWTIPPAGQGGVQSTTNPYATSTTYSPANMPLVVTAPDGITTTKTYDAAFNVLTSATPSSVTTTAYDGDNRDCYDVTASTAQSGLTCTSAAQAGSSATTYVPGGLATASSTDSLGQVTGYYYADLAYPMSPTEVVDPLGTQKSFSTYDDYGNACVTGSVQPTLGASQCATVSGDMSYVFNALGSKSKVTDQVGNVTTNYYENAAYPTNLTRTVNALGATTKYVYDAGGRLLTTVNPDGTGVTTNYNLNGEVCSEEPTLLAYPCGQGPAAAGVTLYSYNDAQERSAMSDNTGNPATPAQWSQMTTYTYATGQLASVTDENAKTVSYLYNYAGQVGCVAYPVSSSASCGTITAPATGSVGNTIVTKSYDASGRLSSLADWLGNTTAYAYGDAHHPGAVTAVTYPASTGLTATYGYDAIGNVTSLAAGSAITDAWTYNADQQVGSTTINGVTSGAVAYDANHRITAATNLATSTVNTTFTLAANGEITGNQPPSGSAVVSTYNAGAELCNTSSASVTCGTAPSTGTSYQFTTNGQRSVATPYSLGSAGAPSYYAWNALGELCNTGASSAACGSTPTSGTSYTYNGDGLRIASTTATTSTASTWDPVSGGTIPLNINDASTTLSSGATTNTSYLYGNPLFGGTAPVEQITGSTATFLVSSQTGVQGAFSSSGSTLELAIYSLYGNQSVTSGSKVTPFGFQGSYTDSTGLIYLINRYYDPTTNQFISVDPAIVQTNQAFIFVNDNPVNATDPLGLKGWYCIGGVSHYYAGNKYGAVGGGKCKPSTAKKPQPGTTTTVAITTLAAPTSAPRPIPSAATTAAVNNYIAATSRPWCYAGAVISASGSLGMTGMATVYSGVLADGPPAWVIVVAGGVTATAIIYSIKLALSC